ncbi:SDR family NAD(P)-dependent oxidoreductase [Musicola paradisiaca]|uniref:6-deoxyerythronolide-B synthase n=1 Tax=Musicola paradisiaca (strain Ech703) TaxID=579405 RepID=C6C2W6_MUSP7|nr:SDR family NAD(P)-dependent oxidoreductase [Musicola paradisiaca]ACS85231.1 6-deoxyerythronolide-B synthase [Musicola paradisiaca Ech703]
MTTQNNDTKDATILTDIRDGVAGNIACPDDLFSIHKKDAVAIIGVGGFFPGADSIEDFCQKLDQQESLFSRVPENHFPGAEMRNRYGAFLKDIAGFDPDLFNIGPMEAEYMDPRTRLLLMSAWHTLEDACYLPQQLREAKVDVYIASEGAAYTPFLAKAELTSYSILGMMSWSLPNYISHAFRFNGKSLYIDTACSGASVALHQAKEALLRKDADYALVGAANLLFGDALAGSYLGQESLGILGGATVCSPFQADAKGFLPAEATVTVLLKRLSQAVADRDNIHGVILGSDVNHTGGYGSLTMPSAESQASVIVNAYRQAGIDANTVTYVEAHGASSLLADAEEIKGFKRADAQLNAHLAPSDLEPSKGSPCKVSTLKPNMGHANSASGMVALVRVLHAFNTQKKPGIKDFSACSDKIRLEGSRFYINDMTEEWPPLRDECGRDIPRRAAINNFGAGGVNAHLLLEEYPRTVDLPVHSNAASDETKPQGDVYFLALSTRHEWQWVHYAKSMLAFLQHAHDVPPGALEYVYLTARHKFDQRVVFRYTSIDNLQEKLAQFIAANGQKSFYLKTGQPDENKAFDIFTRHNRLSDLLKTLDWTHDKNFLMELWVRGVDFPLAQSVGSSGFSKISLPRYPFHLEHYWSTADTTAISPPDAGRHRMRREIHPLVQQNTSDFSIQRYRSFFTGHEFFLADHLVKGQKVLPGVAYLELARAAITDAVGQASRLMLENISWVRPMSVLDAGLNVAIELSPEGNDYVGFEIYSAESSVEGTGRIIHCRGQARVTSLPDDETSHATPATPSPVDIHALQAQCVTRRLDSAACYRAYTAMGILHGPAYQGVVSIDEGDSQAIARIELPACVADTRSQFFLHPSLMDSALQIAAGLLVDAGHPEFALPFALERLEMFPRDTAAALPENLWVWARRKAGSSKADRVRKMDYDLCDETGHVWVRLSGFSSRVVDDASAGAVTATVSVTPEAEAEVNTETGVSREVALPAMHQPAVKMDDPVVMMPRSAAKTAKETLREKLIPLMQKSLAKLRKLEPGQIDLKTELSQFGLDSILLTEFSNQLNRQYRLTLTPTVFFEYPTLSEFVDYLVDVHAAAFSNQFPEQTPFVPPALIGSPKSADVGEPETTAAINEFTVSDDASQRETFRSRGRLNPAFPRSASDKHPVAIASTAHKVEPIAIVGMSGRFPMARDLDAFWDNLVSGKDCIQEIPKQRWDWQALYGDPVREVNKSNVKWGGFIEGIDEFDPLFFGISPKEAELMDPQQRLLMTYIWSAIEDAGYRAGEISGTDTAIFVGTGMSGYSSLITAAQRPIEGYSLTGIVPSVGPNRMSFFLNVHGPSEPIETACSSSLIAIHRAVQSIGAGECEQAIVGGVNTLVTPDGYISFSKAGMLCQDGRCKTFSSEANGYVRGEGVGMLFLRKLSVAEAAGDHIYGLIRASAENHGGRANSLTAPNPKAQTVLLKRAYTNAGVDPRSVGYIEAHGTGTPLGDPIEIDGLKSAFKDLYRKTPATTDLGNRPQHCGLGSVKTNVGHLEMAAGIAGVIKVLLQLQHKTLVKSLHAEQLNPYIKLDDSPFYVVRENMPWVAPVDVQGQALPRRAGVSSFGFGGANAHIVLEEYTGGKATSDVGQNTGKSEPVMVILSAKSTDRLMAAARNLLTRITAENKQPPELSELAYTLQVGREAMEQRLGIIASSIDELAEKLSEFLAGDAVIDALFLGNVRQNKEMLAMVAVDEDMMATLDLWFHKRKYARILALWVRGMPVDWYRLYPQQRPKRISLPTYPFATDRYWITHAHHAAMHVAQSPTTLPPDAAILPPDVKGSAPPPPLLVHPSLAVERQRPEDKPQTDDYFSYVALWDADETSSGKTMATRMADKVLVVGSRQETELEKALVNKLTGQAKRLLRISLGSDAARKTYLIGQDHWACDIQDENAMGHCLNEVGAIQQVFFIAGTAAQDLADAAAITASLKQNELQLLRLVKSLQQGGAKEASIDFTVITQDNHPLSSREIRYHGAGISGLAFALAQGDHRFRVRNLDVSGRDLQTPERREKLVQQVVNEVASERGEQIRLLSGRRYRQTFLRLDPRSFSGESGIKHGGVYLILGGSGTVGRVMTRQLLQHYQAKVIWLGRQPESSPAVQNALAAMETAGIRPDYLQADATDLASLHVAVTQIKRKYPRINGAIFAGLVFDAENTLSQTTEETFWQILQVKASGSLNFYQALQHEALDFLVYFSSCQAFSFSGAATLSAYAAGITFSDTLVRALQHRAAFPIGIINWGFWQASLAGLPASQSIFALSDADGFACFERFATLLQQGRLEQQVCLNASVPVQQLMNLHPHESVFLSHQRQLSSTHSSFDTNSRRLINE